MTVRECQLESCDKPLEGRQRAFCTDGHRKLASKRRLREARRAARPNLHAGVKVVPAAAKILGYQEPRFRLVPPHASSSAAGAISLARSAGLTLDPWQEAFLGDAMADQGGSWAAALVCLIVPRQNGKTEIGAVRAAWEATHAPNRTVVYTSHLFKTDREAFKACRRILEADAFAHFEPVFYRSNGNEAIELNNGSRIQFLARKGGSGRGFTAHLLVMDEAFDLSEETYADLTPATVAAEGSQLWIVSSAPHPDSEVLRRQCIRGRRGEDPRLVYWEYSAPDDSPADSVEAWRAANPAVGYRIGIEDIASSFASMSPETFEREHLGRWAEEDGGGVFPPDVWASLAFLGPLTTTGTRSLGLDTSPVRDSSAIVAAGEIEGGQVLLEVVAVEPGTSWVVPRLKEIASKHSASVVIDKGSPAASLADEIRDAGLTVVETDATDLANACGRFFDSVIEGKVIHRGDSELDRAVSNAERRPLGDRFAWKRRTSKGDITALVAATLAHHAVATLGSRKLVVLLPTGVS